MTVSAHATCQAAYETCQESRNELERRKWTLARRWRRLRTHRHPRSARHATRAALLAGCALALVPTPSAAAEVCRYGGTVSHAGQVVAKTDVTAVGGVLTVDVTLALTATTWLYDVEFLRQETSTWRVGRLESLAVNARDSVNGRVRRQQWDVFLRGAGGLEARRVQAKTLDSMRRRHPGFVGHWAMATFGRPWLQDYAGANPERRPDLDLSDAAMPQDLRSPLALAFYWSRWLPAAGAGVPVFLPGFKQHMRAEIDLGAVMPGQGWRSWQAAIRHSGLSATAASTAKVWVSPDNHLLQLAFDLHAPPGSASGVIRSQGCAGAAISPAG